jgi:hypothetical protein
LKQTKAPDAEIEEEDFPPSNDETSKNEDEKRISTFRQKTEKN